jgi:cation diffusion facilitator family transporter
LAISAFAYFYARRHARDSRFSFGTGKVNSLAAFAGAVLLFAFAAVIGYESFGRLISPVHIKFDQAIFVAVIGIVVNTSCVFILKDSEHAHEDDHEDSQGHHRDHNLWAAYLHVLADAMTAVLAFLALLSGKYLGLYWMDPVMGLVGMVLVSRWSWSLIRVSSRVLLDMQAPESVRDTVRDAIESDHDTRVTDLHVWAVGQGLLAAEIAVVTSEPKDPEHYIRLLPKHLAFAHKTVEVRPCPSQHNEMA